jgi:hypothetical protein
LIIVDFSQVLLANVFAFQEEFKKGADPTRMVGVMRHSLLTSLLGYKQKYSKEFGELVVACDGREYWRKSVYPQYKANRKKSREDSDFDWDNIFKYLAQIRQELVDIFPWKVVHVAAAEGDDVMAVLSEYVTTTRVQQDGLFETSEKVLLITSDGDMKQLHKRFGVKQWSPMQKKFVDKPDEDFLIEKIIRGDSGDGVPSVLCPDDWFVNPEYDGVRAKPVTKKVIEQYKKGVGLSEDEWNRYMRNKTLIDFECIPENVRIDIIAAYEKAEGKTDLNGIMNFLVSVRAKMLLERIQEFK